MSLCDTCGQPAVPEKKFCEECFGMLRDHLAFVCSTCRTDAVPATGLSWHRKDTLPEKITEQVAEARSAGIVYVAVSDTCSFCKPEEHGNAQKTP